MMLASAGNWPEQDVGLLLKAICFSAEKHIDQRRKGEARTPYINHPLEVARILYEEGGVRDINVIVAAILHDTVEDTKTTEAELISQFGPKIAGIVMEVTDDKTLPKAERKRLQIEHAATISQEAKLVKLADKIANLRDMTGAPPAGWDEQRKSDYFRWGWQVVRQMSGINPQLEKIASDLCEGYKRPLESKPSLKGRAP